MTGFEPAITAFLCNWCSHEAADAAGRARLACPAGLREIRLMCSGRVHPEFIFRAFSLGADGVLVLGCRMGECHYKDGNLQAMKRIVLLKQTLPAFGVETERLRFDCLSAGEGKKFARLAFEMREDLIRLGPLKKKGKGQ